MRHKNKTLLHSATLFAIAATISAGCAAPQETLPRASIDISSLGAKPEIDAAETIAKAFAGGAKIVRVPAGTWLVSKIVVPEGATLQGDGDASVLLSAPKASGAFVTLNAKSRLLNLKLSGDNAARNAVQIGPSRDLVIRGVTIEDFKGMAIETDHADDLTIQDCTISKVQRATNLQFSNRVRVLANSVSDCSEHGLQFWGNWKWEAQQSADLQFIGNYVRNGGGGGIWGAGAKRVVVANNVVDGAEDVGIDLEWCTDSTVSGNSVRNAKNGGISLFFSCRNVAITGNAISNDHAISAEDAKADWWVRSGIWLTYTNKKTFPDDTGHRNISIVGNVISNAEGKRRAIWIGSHSDNVSLFGNVLGDGKVFRGGENEPIVEVKETSGVLRDNVKE